jgi:glycosyltransferase 2 family protein
LLCYLFFIILTVIIQFNLVGGFVKESIESLIKSQSGIGLWSRVIILFLILVSIIFLVRFIFKKYSTSKLIMRLKIFFAGLKEGIASIKNLKKRGWFIFHTLFIWSMYLLQVYIGFSAIEAVSHLGLNAACSVLTLATFAIILTPGGIGTFPAAIFLVLSLYGIDQSTGEAFGWLMWGTTTFIILFFGLLSLALLYFNNRNKIKAGTTNNPGNTG